MSQHKAGNKRSRPTVDDNDTTPTYNVDISGLTYKSLSVPDTDTHLDLFVKPVDGRTIVVTSPGPLPTDDQLRRVFGQHGVVHATRHVTPPGILAFPYVLLKFNSSKGAAAALAAPQVLPASATGLKGTYLDFI
jgi:hypothetical protein